MEPLLRPITCLIHAHILTSVTKDHLRTFPPLGLCSCCSICKVHTSCPPLSPHFIRPREGTSFPRVTQSVRVTRESELRFGALPYNSDSSRLSGFFPGVYTSWSVSCFQSSDLLASFPPSFLTHRPRTGPRAQVGHARMQGQCTHVTWRWQHQTCPREGAKCLCSYFLMGKMSFFFHCY